ncbi:MAG: YlxR family protein [Oscillospiraceae bacterium]|nr:YlxR family protein [Oscillospiraceae bacterium]MBQ3224243.1 YlxR family protein [Oscillospiraceae bacterium]MBQ4316027.1 YlxR family protein [Oscillospiraceae bacterium]MBQ6697595.1 YlxR family protein [Oscillospiraceae bacterium]MBQ7053928.1 YlxR family protein [Oscillospiraceae bacterium]
MIKQKKVPMRQCVGCREMKAKAELVRVVKPKEGEISLDFAGKLPGRGAYVCKSAACIEKARKAKALERAFSCPVSAEVYDGLAKKLAEENDGK